MAVGSRRVINSYERESPHFLSSFNEKRRESKEVVIEVGLNSAIEIEFRHNVLCCLSHSVSKTVKWNI